ncbi:uncharacterized protein CTRU02_210826 [Colletotrichum truncatum]|uniref:Uncharacterized protein n=1 Tax=Colletotrichum truncatum TaxID=5467 RepID=A0ACC3YQ95_COLTU|nr:uncharacterized protein CTRU02_03688 [Colletotrichum truncatum]KAF6796710.1 hypothetical protein CTRU02_03688 [Colletotrichum truncatum]
MANFLDLLGKADNSQEERPLMNNKSAMLGIVISFLVFTWLCAILRLWCRFFIVKAAGWDDFFVVILMISLSIGSIGTCVLTDYGLGEHLLQFPELHFDLPKYFQIFYLCNGTLPMSTCFIKIAILLQYLRAFEKGSKSRTLTIIVLVLTSLWGVAYIFLGWVPCLPVRAYWDWTLPVVGRWGFGAQVAEELIRTYESHAMSNMILDCVIFALPLPLYFNGETHKNSRKSVLGLFLLGSVVLMLSAWRLASLIHSRAGTYPTLDPTWYGPTPMVLAILEIDVAAICACLPVFWPILKFSMGNIFVTHEVKVEVTTESAGFGRDSEDLELGRGGGTACSYYRQQSYSMPSPTKDTDALVQPEIFGAYMHGKTTCSVAKHG